jgi:hypothetical protein
MGFFIRGKNSRAPILPASPKIERKAGFKTHFFTYYKEFQHFSVVRLHRSFHDVCEDSLNAINNALNRA